MQDIAQACDVTKTTVSLALRNSPRVSAVMREKIVRTAKRMGYHLNPLVSAHMAHLRSTRIPRYQATLAFVCNWPEERVRARDTHIARYYFGAKDRAAELGYVLESFYLDKPHMSARRLDGVMQARGISGLVVAPLFKPAGKLHLDWGHYASLALGFSLTEPDIDRACHDNYGTMRRALHKLGKLGYQKAGLAMPADDDIRVRNLWLAGYLVHQHGPDMPKTVSPCVPAEWNKAVFVKWFQRHQPDVVISASAEALEWLREEGVRVPEDVGYLTVAAQGTEVSGFDQDFEQIGVAAVVKVTSLLHRYDMGVPEKPRVILVEGNWINGRTLRNPTADD